MSERFARNPRGRVQPRSGWRMRSASSLRSCAYRGCRCCPGSCQQHPTPLLITWRVPGSLCSRSPTGSTGIVKADGSGSSWRPCATRQPRTCRGRRGQAHRHAVPQTMTTYPARPVRDWVQPDQRRPLRTGASGRRRAGLCPAETLRPLPGQQAAAPAAAQHGPHVLARTRRQPRIAAAIRASACSRRAIPPGWIPP